MSINTFYAQALVQKLKVADGVATHSKLCWCKGGGWLIMVGVSNTTLHKTTSEVGVASLSTPLDHPLMQHLHMQLEVPLVILNSELDFHAWEYTHVSFNYAGIKSSASLEQELTKFNNGQDFDGLEHFSYNNSGFVSLLLSHLENTNFDGITVSNHSIALYLILHP